MNPNSLVNPRALTLLLILASCWVQGTYSRPGNHRSIDTSLPTKSSGRAAGDAPAAIMRAEPSDGSRETFLVRRRRQDIPDPPTPIVPVPDLPPQPPHIREPDIPSTDTATLRVPGGPFRFFNPSRFSNPFSFTNPFAGPPPPRRYGRPYYGRRYNRPYYGRGSYYRNDPVSSFFGGIESFKRDLFNFFG